MAKPSNITRGHWHKRRACVRCVFGVMAVLMLSLIDPRRFALGEVQIDDSGVTMDDKDSPRPLDPNSVQNPLPGSTRVGAKEPLFAPPNAPDLRNNSLIDASSTTQDNPALPLRQP